MLIVLINFWLIESQQILFSPQFLLRYKLGHLLYNGIEPPMLVSNLFTFDQSIL